MTISTNLAQISRRLVEAALGGGSDHDLVELLGAELGAAGLTLAGIEVACDVVDPERAQHFVGWRPDIGAVGDCSLGDRIFQHMLEEDMTELRLDPASHLFAPVLGAGASDAVAFASHLAPDATLGFFDDVMSLFITERPGGFADRELDLLRLATPVFALALGARLNAAAARLLLRTYLGRDAATALLDGRVGLGDVAQIRAVVLYCDLLGFTALTEKLAARSLVEQLNLFFETMARPVSRAGGQVSGHVGDAVVMFFPIPEGEDEGRVCAAAIAAALEGLADLARLDASRDERAEPLQARIGIDVGDVVHGNIGSTGRFSFTIIGTPVNRAARLQALAKELDAAILMTADLARAAGVRCTSFGAHALRGFDRLVDLVGVERARSPERESRLVRSAAR